MATQHGLLDCEAPRVGQDSLWHIHDGLWADAEVGPLLLEAGKDTSSEPPPRRLPVRLVAAAFASLAGCSLAGASYVLVTGHGRAAAIAAKPQERFTDNLIMETAVGSWAGAGRCGLATNMLDNNEAAMSSFCSMNLDFWWNWAPVPRNTYAATCAWPKFVPMIWGSGTDNKWIARKAGETWSFLMGYNEPDLWGPPAYPGGPYLSSGTFAPTFHCGSPELANEWRDMVMYYRQTSPGGTIVSPAMADPSHFASTGGDQAQCNSSPQTWQQHMPWCLGWMKCFKDNVIKLDCGGGLNCWDQIDVLQFHAYEYDAQNLIDKVRAWETLWVDELHGLNGRRKKTLWLTEFAHAGTTDSSDPDGQGVAFMEKSVAYLKSSPYVSGWSWFSQTFPSFTIDGKAPTSPMWNSELITKEGQITRLGQRYRELCASTPPTPTAM